MSGRKIAGVICIVISILAIVAMFITADAYKGSTWTTIDWITVHFSYGYYAFIIGSVVFAFIGIFMFGKKTIDWSWFSRHPKVMKVLIIVGLVIALIVLFKACGALFDELGFGDSGGSSGGSGTCGICGGDGVVTQKSLGDGSGVQSGFDTYYRCKGCNGTGRKRN